MSVLERSLLYNVDNANDLFVPFSIYFTINVVKIF